MFKKLKVVSLVLLLGGCASITPQPIDLSEVPEGLWDEYKIVTSDFRLSNPNMASSRRPNDCPGQPVAGSISGAMCVEVRNLDPEKNCNIVSSTFGNGYCPKTYSNDEYGRKTAELDGIMAAGTAAQNAVLAYGQNLSRKMQEDGLRFLQTYQLSGTLGSNSSMSEGTESLDTVLIEQKDFSGGDVLAYSRFGFYTQCVTPNFDAAYNASLGSWYYRIAKGAPACKVPTKAKYFMPDYMNAKSTESAASFVYPYKMTEKGGLISLSMVEPSFGMKAFSKDDLVSPDDIRKHLGFAEKKSDVIKRLTVADVGNDSVTLTFVTNINGDLNDAQVVLNTMAPKENFDGVEVTYISSDSNRTVLLVEGQFL